MNRSGPQTFVTALGTEKNLELFEVEGVGEGEGLESDNVIVLEEGVENGEDFGLKDEGVENSKFELVVELAPGLWGCCTM
jgi:hypothetical protein